jgi:CheY-like chemotaxis protein
MFFPLVADREKFQRSLKEQRLRHGSERILVVDDEEHVREMICRMLQTLGHDVEFVESGQEAIDLVEKKELFDLVILDMNMPTMSGKDTFFKLKEIKPDLRVVISTGYSNASLEPTNLNDFVDGFLQKPYQMEELSKVLRDVFDEKHD